MTTQAEKETIARLMMNWQQWLEGPSVSSSAGMWARAGRGSRAVSTMPIINADAQRTDRALAQISEREREALCMEYAETLGQQQMAARLKLSTRQLRRVLLRAEAAFLFAYREGRLDRRAINDSLENPNTPMSA